MGRRRDGHLTGRSAEVGPLHRDFHPLIQVTMRGRRSKLSLLISTATLAPSVRAALLPHLAGLRRQAALTTMRRDFASAPPWERPPDELRAVCDHRTRTCRLFSTSRSGGGRNCMTLRR